MPIAFTPLKEMPQQPFAHAPLLPYATALIGGIALAWALRSSVSAVAWLIVAAALLGAFVGLWLLRSRRWTLRWTFCVSLLFWGSFGAWLLSDTYERDEVAWPQEQRRWNGRVEQVQKRNERGTSVLVRLVAPEQPACDGRLVNVFLADTLVRSLGADCPIVFEAQVENPSNKGNPGDFDFATYYRSHHIVGTAYVRAGKWRAADAAAPKSVRGWLLRVRERLVAQYTDYFEGEQLAVLSALTLGDKTMLNAATRQSFSETGTSHILALSGLHLSIIFGLFSVSFVHQWLRRHRRTNIVLSLLLIAAMWCFVALTGAPLSLVRSAAMLTAVQVAGALFLGRGSTLNNLSLAALVILLCDPLALLDISFQLSFWAVLTIVLFGRYFWNRIPQPFYEVPRKRKVGWPLRYACTVGVWCWRLFFSFASVSLSAQVGTLPFILYYFHQVAPYALLANVVVIPLAHVLLYGAFLFLLIPLEPVRWLLAEALRWSLTAMTSGVEFVASLPGASMRAYPSALTLVALTVLVPVVFIFFAAALRRPARLRLIALSALLVALAIGGEMKRAAELRVEGQIVFYKASRAALVHFIDEPAHSYIYSTASPDSVRLLLARVEQNFLEPRGIAFPQQVSDTLFRSPALNVQDGAFVFRGKRVVVLRRKVTPADGAPVPVDYVLVCRGCYASLAEVRKRFEPRHVVLDNTLPNRLRERWDEECRAAGIPVHDLRRDGALIVETKPE